MHRLFDPDAMRACFMSMAVTVLDFVFFLNFAVKWRTSAVTRSVLFKVLYLTIIRRRRSEYCRIIPETKSRGLFDNIH